MVSSDTRTVFLLSNIGSCDRWNGWNVPHTSGRLVCIAVLYFLNLRSVEEHINAIVCVWLLFQKVENLIVLTDLLQ